MFFHRRGPIFRGFQPRLHVPASTLQGLYVQYVQTWRSLFTKILVSKCSFTGEGQSSGASSLNFTYLQVRSKVCTVYSTVQWPQGCIKSDPSLNNCVLPPTKQYSGRRVALNPIQVWTIMYYPQASSKVAQGCIKSDPSLNNYVYNSGKSAKWSSDMKSRRTWNLKWHIKYILKVGLLRLNVLAGTRYKVQGTRYKVPGTRYKVQGTWNLKWHEISKDMKSQMTSNLSPTPHISKFLRYSEFCYTGEFSAKDFFKTKQKWVLFIHYYVNCHELLMFMKCQMSNVQLSATVHCSHLITVHNCSPFTTDCSQLCTVCLFLKDRCTN